MKARQSYRWSLEVGAVKGGIQEASDEFLFEAPASGYLSHIEYTMVPTNEAWTSVLKKRFYFRSRNGSPYGAMDVTVRPDYSGKSAIQLESVVDTNASRNLQH